MHCNNHFIYILYSCLCCFLISACSSHDSFIYNGRQGINFVSAHHDIALGSLPYNISDTTLSIPLELIGFTSSQTQAYHIEIDSQETNATQGIHFQPFAFERTIAPQAYHDTLYIRVNRRALDNDTYYKLTLRIAAASPLPAGIEELRATRITFTNRLDKPQWWNELAYWLGEYDIRKYQKFIEYNGAPITSEDVADRKYDILRIFKRVKSFFEAQFSTGITFPDVAWEV